MKTTIIGWKPKKFDGVIEGKEIHSDNIELQLIKEGSSDPNVHGKEAEKLKVKRDFLIRLNGGSEDFNLLLGCNVILSYEIVNNKPFLADIMFIGADGVARTSPDTKVGTK